MIYTFEIPVTGREVVEVEAANEDEALKKLLDGEHKDSYVPEVDWSENPTLDYLT